MDILKISRLEAHEIQNQMRDELEHLTGSYSTITQKPYLADALIDAVDSVINRSENEGFYKPITFSKGEFIVVFDMDETLITQWYKKGLGVGQNRIADLTVNIRDVVPGFVDWETGNSSKTPELYFSSTSIKIRPNINDLFNKISKLQGFKGFVLFTAKGDNAAWNLFNHWKSKDPELFKNVIGFYTRNYLKFDGNLKKASKDLRIFDPTLTHVFIIDDNESRVIQPDLGYAIPAFSADSYIESLSNSEKKWVKTLHEGLFPYLYETIEKCVVSKEENGTQSPTSCFSEKLGKLHIQKNGELKAYVDYISKKYPDMSFSLDTIIKEKVFEQDFDITITRPLNEKYPIFKNGKMVLTKE
jgi:hypothetical protein